MATFKAVVLEHHKKEDNTYNTKIRVTHRRLSRYIDTDYYLVKQQLYKDFEIKDPVVLNRINDILKQYREEVIALGDSINLMDVDDLKMHLVNKFKKKQSEGIDFISFITDYIEEVKKGSDSSAGCFSAVKNSLCYFFGRTNIVVSEINYQFLIKWDSYLRNEREILMDNGKIKKLKKLEDPGVHHYMRDLRTLFNKARLRYNDEDTGVIRIPHYPFRKFKIGDAPETEKRNLPIEIIQKIRDLTDLKENSTAKLAQDFTMISLYLIGMNCADIYQIDKAQNGRIGYNRAKTKGKRSDKAFISIKIEPELLPYIEKNKDTSSKRIFHFYKRYSDNKNFVKAVNTGYKAICKLIDYKGKITTYSIRHTWGTTARNSCRIPKEDISMALNHVDKLHDVTDIYIEKDWTIIDEANRKVIDFINNYQKDSK